MWIYILWLKLNPYLVRTKPLWDTLSLQLLFRLTKCQSVGLREKVAHQLIVVGNLFSLEHDGTLGLAVAYKVRRDNAALARFEVKGSRSEDGGGE